MASALDLPQAQAAPRRVRPYQLTIEAMEAKQAALNEEARMKRATEERLQAAADREAAAATAKQAQDALQAPLDIRKREMENAEAERKNRLSLAIGEATSRIAPQSFPGNADPAYAAGNPDRVPFHQLRPELQQRFVSAYGADVLPDVAKNWNETVAGMQPPPKAPAGMVEEQTITTSPEGKVSTTRSFKAPTGAQTGVTFENAEAAEKAGYNPEGADVLEDGRIRITKLARNDRSRQKLDVNQKNALSGAVSAANSLNTIADDYAQLDKEGKVGPVAGRWQAFKQGVGVGDRKYSEFGAQSGANLFTLARALQGAGVLTEQDIKRMETIVPTGTMNPEQFRGQLSGIRKIMLERLNAWKIVNARSMMPDELTQVNQVIGALSTDRAPGAAQQPPAAPAPTSTPQPTPAPTPAPAPAAPKAPTSPNSGTTQIPTGSRFMRDKQTGQVHVVAPDGKYLGILQQ